MLNPDKIRRIVFSLMILAASIYTGFSLWRYWQYVRLDGVAAISSVEWNVHTNSEESHQIKADYTYSYRGHEYSGMTVFAKPVFINHLGAEYALKDFANESHQVYVSTTDPELSSLERNFPMKELISAVILWGIIVYLFSLTSPPDAG